MILAIYGDSISTEEYREHGYAHLLQDALGLEKVYNHSIVATTLAAAVADSGIEIIQKEENWHPDADVVILWYGTNDWYFGNLPGEEDSRDINTFNGALNESVRILREVNPEVKIILPTPNLRFQAPDGGEKDGDARVTPNKAGLTQGVYTQAVVNAGERLGCTVINMQKATGFTFEEMEKYFPDGVHPSKDGYEIISRIFADTITEIME